MAATGYISSPHFSNLSLSFVIGRHLPHTSILPHFLSSSRNETIDASSDGFCIPVVVFNRGVSKEQQILCLRN